jgi:NAD(P)-dependent dehydrogenase (short-subunit alcohol dehydrogenase family)
MNLKVKVENKDLIPQAMQDKVVLITGATSGIGEVTALALAEKGATVIVVGRTPERASATVEKIRQSTANRKVDYILADLSSLGQVRDLANAFRQQYDRLDVLINNAGAVFFKKEFSVDHYERTFALNYLSYFLLTNLLLDQIRAAAQLAGEARIVNVSSDIHRGSKIYFDDLMFEHRSYGVGGVRAYSQTKLADVLFTFELARRLEGSTVTSNACHPGLVSSNIGKNNGLLGKLSMGVVNRFAISPQEGAQTPIYLASWPAIKGYSGKYFTKCQPVRADKKTYDLNTAKQLWEISEELVSPFYSP